MVFHRRITPGGFAAGGIPIIDSRNLGAQPGVANAGVVNGGRFLYLPAAKIVIFRDFAYKNAILKVR